MSFFADLEREDYDRSYRDRDLVARLAEYFRPQRRRVLIAALATGLIAAGEAASPILVSQGVGLLQRNPAAVPASWIAGVLFLLGMLVWSVNWVRRRMLTRAVGAVMLDLRTEAFAATAAHDLAFYDEHASGKIVSRITSDTNEFAQVAVLVTDVASEILQVAILIVVLLRIEWSLTLWVLGMIPIFLLVALGFRRLARRVIRRSMRGIANVNASIKEAVTGITVAKNFRQEQAIYAEFDRINMQSYGANVRRGFVLSVVFPTLNAMMGFGTALMVFLGGSSAVRGAVAVGTWYLFMRSLDRFWFPILSLSAFWSQIQGGLSAAERVFALIDTESQVRQTGQLTIPRLHGQIHFEQVDFRYHPQEPVLEGFSLVIEPGESLALVGHTGAGKSSIVKLITRFYEFQAGRVLVDGLDIRSLDLHDFRRQIGLVSQNPFLFAGTVIDNIRYARPEVSDEEITALAQQIGSGEWLETLPQGLLSKVGERGARLSMGQRQLVSLMRVLVRRPAIFILDEATANIDPFTESQIQEALQLILAETTSILIAHRLSTVRACDRIVVLRQGRVIEQGDHDRLMAQGGHYAELYNTYFRHQSLAYVQQSRLAAAAS